MRPLDASAVKPAPLTGIAARIGVPPPAGFGLDFLPGSQSVMQLTGALSIEIETMLSVWAGWQPVSNLSRVVQGCFVMMRSANCRLQAPEGCTANGVLPETVKW